MEYLIIASVLIGVVIIVAEIVKKLPKDNSTSHSEPEPSPFEYDENGYNGFGYNAFGKNEQGQYNRFHDTTSYEEEGFYNPWLYRITLTDHARERMYERLGINAVEIMRKKATDAYKYGKSKRQLKKTSARMVEEIEQRYDGKKVLIYENHIYIFTENNVLITVYKNDRIPL